MRKDARKKRRAYLLPINPTGESAREYSLKPPECLVGSDDSNDLVIRDPSVSRRHALIRFHRRAWQIIDKHSTNGTYVGSRTAAEWLVLRDGQEVRFGGARFVFRSGAALTSAPTKNSDARGIRIRTILVVIVAASLIGFAATQYFVYRSYQNRTKETKPATFARRTTAAMAAQSARRIENSNPKRSDSIASQAHSPWLRRINYWRELAGVPRISSAEKLSAAATEHSRYMVKHALEGKLRDLAGGGAHTENPSDRWYTPAGSAAGQHGDVTPPCTGCPLLSPAQEIDGFITVPFHRVSVLDPLLTKAGFGSYTEGGLQGSVLYLPIPPHRRVIYKQPIEFPPNGSTVGLAAYAPEWPNPLLSCADYTSPAGLPITLELGSWLVPEVSAHSLKAEGLALESCVFTAATFNDPYPSGQTRARGVLKGYGAVVLIPRNPLTSGQTYQVSITADGADYSWSFKVR